MASIVLGNQSSFNGSTLVQDRQVPDPILGLSEAIQGKLMIVSFKSYRIQASPAKHCGKSYTKVRMLFAHHLLHNRLLRSS